MTDLPSPLPSDPSCKHDKGKYWRKEIGSDYFEKKHYPTCLFCKPAKDHSMCRVNLNNYDIDCNIQLPKPTPSVEPSVESIAEEIMKNLVTIYDYNKLKKLIAEALRNERNRK